MKAGHVFISAIAIFGFLNWMPHMVFPDGTQQFFVFSVPQPERFALHYEGSSGAVLNRGFPMTMYSTVGHVFTSKEGNKLFLPAYQQPPFPERVSLSGLIANSIFITCACGIMLFIKHKMTTPNKIRPKIDASGRATN